MALTMSSIPVYIDFLSVPEYHAEKKQVNQSYLSALIIISSAAIIVLVGVLIILKTNIYIFIAR